MECIWCAHKPCICHDTVEDAKNRGIELGQAVGYENNPYNMDTPQDLAFKEGIIIGNGRRIRREADQPWSSTEFYAVIQAVIKEEDAVKRLTLALESIVYYSAYLTATEHSKYSAVCSTVALSPETYRKKEG